MKHRKNIFVRLCLSILSFFLILLGCSKDAQQAAATTTGTGGSLAKFTIAGNYLYVVDNNYLFTFDITNTNSPVKKSTVLLGNSIETIFPYKNRLFIGSSTGMFIYSIDTPSLPSKLGLALHVRSCDPVVANDTVSFSTLKGSTRCGPATSGLYIYDIKSVTNPDLKKLIPINSPQGLGLKDSILYVCNNTNGINIYNVTTPFNPTQRNIFNDGSNYIDVIPFGNILICYVNDGIRLLDITNPVNPVLVKQIAN